MTNNGPSANQLEASFRVRQECAASTLAAMHRQSFVTLLGKDLYKKLVRKVGKDGDPVEELRAIVGDALT